MKTDICNDCHKPIYETEVANVPEHLRLQWIHTQTGCHYCDSVRHNPQHVATPSGANNESTS